MFFSAMDLGWKRVHLSIFLIFLKYAVGYGGWNPQNVQPQQDFPVHKHFSPRGLRSSVFEAPATGSIPFEEVAPNDVPGKSYSNMLTASSPDSSGLQLGGNSSPLSTQSSSSTGSSGSYRRLFTSISQGSSGPKLTGGFSQPVSTSGLLAQSQSTGSKNTPGSYAKLLASPIVFSQSTSGQSSYSQYTSSSQSQGGTPLKASLQYVPGQGGSYDLSAQRQGTSSQYAPALSFSAKLPVSSQYYQATQSGSPSPSWSSPELQPSTSMTQGFQASRTAVLQGSGTSQSSSWLPSRSPLLSSAGGSISSTDRSSAQSQDTSSQKAPVPLGSKVPVYIQAAQSGSSLSLSQPSQWQPSATRSQSLQFFGLGASQSSPPSQGFKAPSKFSPSAINPGQFAPTQEGSYSGLSSLSQSASTPYSLGAPAYAKPGSSLLDTSSQSASGQSSYRQYTPSSQSRAGTQLAGSSPYVPVSTPTDGSSLQLQGTAALYAPPALGAKVPVYGQADPSGSLSPSQLSQWRPSSRWSHSFQTSGTVASQSSSPSQGSMAPSKFSTIISAANPSQFASAQEGRGMSNQYSPGYTKLSASLLGVSPSTSGQSSYSQYTSSSQSSAGTQLQGSTYYAPVQTGSTSTDRSSLQLQGTSGLYAPLPPSAKVPVYSLAAPSRPSTSLSQPSKWQTSSSWSQGFQTPGTVALQSGTASQGSKALIRFPTLASAASTGQFASKQQGSGGYSSLSRQSQDASSQYSPGSSAYDKRGSSINLSTQSTSDQSSSGLYVTDSQSMAGTQLAGSNRYVPAQTGSTPTGAALKVHSCNHHAPSVSCECGHASPSGSPLTGSKASG